MDKSQNTFSEDQLKLARISKALSHPVRIYIMQLLSKQTCCYSGDLSEELPIAKSTLSQHLKELKTAFFMGDSSPLANGFGMTTMFTQ